MESQGRISPKSYQNLAFERKATKGKSEALSLEIVTIMDLLLREEDQKRSKGRRICLWIESFLGGIQRHFAV